MLNCEQNTGKEKIDNLATPTISIIIPTYQAGETLKNALDSIVSQTYRDVEVLIMDGGSSDGTATVAQEVLPSHQNVSRFIRSRTLGFTTR